MINLVIIYETVPYGTVRINEGCNFLVKIILLHQHDSRPYARNQEHQNQESSHSLCPQPEALIRIFNFLETEIPDQEICSHCNEQAIDAEKIESTEEGTEITDRKSVTGCTQWWHQGCSNGHSREDCTLFLPALLEDTGKATEQGYHHIKYCRARSCKKFCRVTQAERSDYKVKQRYDQTDRDHYKKVLSGMLQQFYIIDSKTETKTEDRPHKRRYEHGTNDDRD